ncbi:hypothetical protein H6F46_11950 [Limnothrix sp. FACHB-1083]|uniref:hypothetical protein n=1 Tax=unclassified Limnothrix TaxID=2632864 RepID=UPI001681B570|nr:MULTISPECIES: hypothetical protein [unclassified Limnothrix]MBD2161403.1 hypothetical protein [Limnothrix sp. FACHB-1083]MBD2192085.1 hypothetical protein [Limnothrix sp. FACHB-1088]
MYAGYIEYIEFRAHRSKQMTESQIEAANDTRNIANLREIAPVGSQWKNRATGETVTVTRVYTCYDNQEIQIEGRKTGYEPRTFFNEHRRA